MDFFNKSAEFLHDAANSVAGEMATTRKNEGYISLDLLTKIVLDNGYLSQTIDVKPETQITATETTSTMPASIVEMEPVEVEAAVEPVETTSKSTDEFTIARQQAAKARQSLDDIYRNETAA